MNHQYSSDAYANHCLSYSYAFMSGQQETPQP